MFYDLQILVIINSKNKYTRSKLKFIRRGSRYILETVIQQDLQFGN